MRRFSVEPHAATTLKGLEVSSDVNYQFQKTLRLIPKSEDKAGSFSVNANPEQAEGIGATGKNFYYIDPESGICFSQVSPATAQDDTL
jgi:hypothetical protein